MNSQVIREISPESLLFNRWPLPKKFIPVTVLLNLRLSVKDLTRSKLLYSVQGGPKTAQWNSFREISAKCWPEMVEFGSTLAAPFVSILGWKLHKYVVYVKRHGHFIHAYWHDAVTKCVYYITFKITVTLDSFKHAKLWQRTSVFTVSFTVSSLLLVDALQWVKPVTDGVVNEFERVCSTQWWPHAGAAPLSRRRPAVHHLLNSTPNRQCCTKYWAWVLK